MAPKQRVKCTTCYLGEIAPKVEQIFCTYGLGLSGFMLQCSTVPSWATVEKHSKIYKKNIINVRCYARHDFSGATGPNA